MNPEILFFSIAFLFLSFRPLRILAGLEIVQTDRIGYSSAADQSKWFLRCGATANNSDDTVKLIKGDKAGTTGTMTSKISLPTTPDLGFRFDIHILTDVPLGDGYAIYITNNASVSTQECCAACSNAHFGILKPPGDTLGIRAYKTAISVNMFPTRPSETNYPEMGNSSDFKGFAWPWVTVPNTAPKQLGNCTDFASDYLGDATISITLTKAGLSVDLGSKSNASSLKSWSCVKNAPAFAGLLSLMKSGSAVLVIAGGMGDLARNTNPLVKSVRFYEFQNVTTTTLMETTAKITTTRVVTTTATKTTRTRTSTPISSKATPTTPTSRPVPVTDLLVTPQSTSMPSELPKKIIEAYQGSAWMQQQKFVFIPAKDKLGPPIEASAIVKQCGDFAPNRAAPPPLNGSSVAYINASFGIDRFHDIDTVSETISVSGCMLLSWTVSSCPVNSSDQFTTRPPEALYVAQTSDVWTPAYQFASETSPIYMQKTEKFGDDVIVIMSKAANSPNRSLNFYWIKAGIFVSPCQLDLAKFPFDEQTCAFTFSLLRSTAILQFGNEPGFFWPVDDERQSDEWHYKSKNVDPGTGYYRGLPTGALFFSVVLKRNSAYYVTNLIIPNALLVLVQLVTFVLQPNIPDRAGFSVTILLAITVAQSTINAQVPKTGQRILLIDYVYALSFICAGCTAYQMVACWYANRLEINGSGNKSSKQDKGRCCKLIRICDFVTASLALAAFICVNVYLCLEAFN